MVHGVLSQDEFALLLGRARELRSRVDGLDDSSEIDGAVRAHVQDIADPPEPPPRHGELIAAAIELLEDERLSPDQANALERAFLGTE